MFQFLSPQAAKRGWKEPETTLRQLRGARPLWAEFLGRSKRFSVTVPVSPQDPKHSMGEDRLIAIGRTVTGRPMFVGFTIRAKNGRRLIRPVTARFMHAKEAAVYEEFQG